MHSIEANVEQAARGPKSGQPPASFFQRQAGLWLDLVRQNASDANLPEPMLGKGRVDLLDFLRSELLVRLGADLAAIHRQRTGPSHSAPGSSRAKAGPLRALWNRLHVQAYELKRSIQRSRRGRFHPDPKWAQQSPVLVVVRTQGHVSDTLPVAEQLRQNFQIPSIFAVSDPRIAQRVRAAGFPTCPFSIRPNALGSSEIGRSLAALEPLYAAIDRLLPSLEPFDAEQTARLVARTRQLLAERAASSIELAYTVAQLIEGLRPAAVLAGNPYTLEGKLATAFAGDYGVPAAAIEHGAILENDPRWDRCQLDLVCAWGEHSRVALEHNGFAAAQIALTGSPRHDAVFRSVTDSTAAASDERTAQILVATSGPGDQVGIVEHEHFIEMLASAVAQTPELRWVIKLHPKDRLEYYEPVSAVGGARVQIVRGKPDDGGLEIFEYLKSSRALITITSSTALDAMSVRVPVISVDVWQSGQRPRGIAFLERGCTRRAQSAAELAAKAQAAWNGQSEPETDEAARQYACEHFVNQGHAAEAVAKRLAQLVARPAN